jgi:hypothetical protein
MSNIKKYIPYWITKDGTSISIKAMATTHLMNVIHLIERSRMQQLISIEQNAQDIPTEDALRMLDYYTAWPDKYGDLLAEAEKRKLIRRK